MTREELTKEEMIKKIKAVDLPFITGVVIENDGMVIVEHLWCTYRYASFEEALVDTEEESEWFYHWHEAPSRFWAEDILNKWDFFKSAVDYYTDGEDYEPYCWLECDWRLSEDCSEITFKAKGNDCKGITKKKIFKAVVPEEIQEQLIKKWKTKK